MANQVKNFFKIDDFKYDYEIEYFKYDYSKAKDYKQSTQDLLVQVFV